MAQVKIPITLDEEMFHLCVMNIFFAPMSPNAVEFRKGWKSYMKRHYNYGDYHSYGYKAGWVACRRFRSEDDARS